MIRSRLQLLLLPALVMFVAVIPKPEPALAQDKDKGKINTDEMVEKGLEYLKRMQNPDGHWDGGGGMYPTVMTGLAGMALLMEGSTLREGKYSDNLVKAVDWFLTRSQNNGLLGNPQNPTESSRYIYGHGFGLLFLSCAYGEEEDEKRRKKLEAVIKKAVEFSGKAQTKQGGWGYVSAADGGGFDEGSTTVTQLQGLRAARNAGIVVPKSIIDNSTEYLRKCTTPRGGLIYNLGQGQVAQAGSECQAITAAAVASAFSSGQYDDKYGKMWIKYCKTAIYGSGGRGGQGAGHDEYQSYYFTQAMFVLGDDRYEKLFPDEKKDDRMLWSKYREVAFAHYKSGQQSDGSWNGGYAGPMLATTFALAVLQLEKGVLPFYHR